MAAGGKGPNLGGLERGPVVVPESGASGKDVFVGGLRLP